MRPDGAGMRLVESCGGAELHWVGEPRGESLQGWYKSKTQARKAHAALPPLQDGTKLPLLIGWCQFDCGAPGCGGGCRT